VLVAQLKYRQALTLAGVDDIQQAATWYSERAKALAANNQESWQHFLLGLRVSRLLNDLGEEDAAIALLSKAADFPGDKEGLRSFNVFVEEVRQGRRNAALRRGATLLSMESRAAGVASELFGQRGPSALQWWQLLRERSPEDDPAKTLIRLQAMFDPAQDWPLPGETLEQLAAQAADGVPALESSKQFPRIWAIVELAVQRQEKKLARAYLEQAEALTGTTTNGTPAQWIGDLLAEEKDWSAAAAAYGRAWQRDKSLAIPLYMQGHALMQAGEKAEGERLMRLASLLPLADPLRRHQFAEGLAQRGMKDQAVQQRELVVRFGAAGTWAGNDDWHFRDAARLLGDHVETTDAARAAVLWQRVMYGVIRSNSHYWERADYAKMFSVIHKVRARSLLATGKADDGIEELNLAVAARPGDLSLVEQLMPDLISVGRKDAAEKLFADAFTAYEEICRDFPQSAKHHNELAWLAARTDRRLDDALAHAEEAVRIRPEALNYVDTLAEVHFRRGDRNKAIELAKQNLAKEPKNKHFQEQSRRFAE
jgi:tetratricopeptide (TPR) repeat protein